MARLEDIMWAKAITIACVVGLASPAQPEELIQATPLTETLGDQAMISGNVVVGFLSVGEVPKEKPYLEALVTERWQGSRVCLTLVSQDGRYEAFAEYTVPRRWAGGSIRVPLQSSYNEYLKDTKRAQFAGMLRKGYCNESGGNVAPLGWNEKLEPKDVPPNVQLLVNSRAADEVYLVFDQGDDVDCVKTESTVHLAFDFVCDISRDVIALGNLIEVNRIRNGRKDRPHLVQVQSFP